jgi:hypothetical protein
MTITKRLELVEHVFAEFGVALENWSKAEDLIWKLVEDCNTFSGLADELNVERILIESVPPIKRFLLERWFGAVRRLDKHIDELADTSMDIEGAFSEELDLADIVSGQDDDDNNDGEFPGC